MFIIGNKVLEDKIEEYWTRKMKQFGGDWKMLDWKDEANKRRLKNVRLEKWSKSRWLK
jgi:hypothetical protein